MKKTTLLLAAFSAAFVVQSHATVVFTENFDYPDGNLVGNGSWAAHSSAGSVPVQVSSSKAVVSQTGFEDVNAPLSGAPITTETLYTALTVNFSALPVGTGGYFFNLKDTGTSNLRGRIFASTTGAASGKFRLGVANGGNTAAFIPTDLDLDTEMKIVLRYNTATAASTLWINPSTESSIVNRIDASDSTSAVGITNICLRQSTASGNGMGVLTVDNIVVGTAFSDVVAAGGPPAISGVSSQSLPVNGTTGPLAFTVDDSDTPAANLVVTAQSSNTTLVPNGNIVLGGTDGNRTVTVTPASGQQGTATITLTVTDDQALSTDTTFDVIVGAPTISAIGEQDTYVDTATAPIAFTVSDAETAAGSLTLSGTSSNTDLVPNGNISFGGSGGNRTVTITPAAGQTGLTTITVTVGDGTHNISETFVLTVAPNLGIIASDDFNRADGPLVDFSGKWVLHSGTLQQTQITNQQVNLTFSNSEDVGTDLTGAPYSTNSGAILYAGFTVNFSALPSGAGAYFAHFKDEGTFNFRARVIAQTNTAAPGKFRLAISTAANTPLAQGIVARDLSTNVTYKVAIKYNVGTGTSKLWVDPTGENDPSAGISFDAITPVHMTMFALRQNSGMGSLLMDDLKVGSSLTNVIELSTAVVPVPLEVVRNGSNIEISWPETATGTLQGTPSLNTIDWQPVVETPVTANGKQTVTIPAANAHRFFRLQQ